MRLFGTDGIRGCVRDELMTPAEALRCLDEERTISPALFLLLGEGIGGTLSEGDEVVIGWDERPLNPELAQALSLGLRRQGAVITWAGAVATPGLQCSLLHRQAALGCMITASHNPVQDSGVKLFDADGYKSMPAWEDVLSAAVRKLAASPVPAAATADWRGLEPDRHLDGSALHQDLLERRLRLLRAALGDPGRRDTPPLLIDGSGGSAELWLRPWLQARGIPCEGVGTPEALNQGCGAGGLSPTAAWTWEELESPTGHLLLDAIRHRYAATRGEGLPLGALLGAALDGDGDRCLFLELRADGVGVLDGDRMADGLLRASSALGSSPWTLASSIETDLGLKLSHQTAVGDRWLSQALSPPPEAPGRLLWGRSMPAVLGSEDSGHLVMAAPHPVLEDHWSLVGDGVASLLAVLCADATLPQGIASGGFQRGWKSRVSIRGSDRRRWDGVNPLSHELEDRAKALLERWGELSSWGRVSVEGETSLLLLEGTLGAGRFGLGVRNSGTEAKTNISLRLSPELRDLAPQAQELMGALRRFLEPRLLPGT